MKGSIENNDFHVILTNRMTVASSLLNSSLLLFVNSGTNNFSSVARRYTDGGAASVVEGTLVVALTAAVILAVAVVAPVNLDPAVVSRKKHLDEKTGRTSLSHFRNWDGGRSRTSFSCLVSSLQSTRPTLISFLASAIGQMS